MLDLRKLRALHAVVETGSVTAAAKQVAYTPSAISQHIAALERETGLVLLERSGRGVRPTEAGQLLAQHAGILLARMAEAETAMASLRAGELGILRIVSFPTAGAALVPPALAALRRELPRLDVDLRVAETEQALPMLRQGDVDVAVLEEFPSDGQILADGLSRHHLLDDPYRVVLPSGHRLAGEYTIDLADLAEDPWVETSCGLCCCWEVSRQAFRRAGFVPRRAVEAADYWAAQSFVAAGLGVAMIPTLGLGVVHNDVTVRRLGPDPEPSRRVLAVTRPAMDERIPIRAMLAALDTAARAHLHSTNAPPNTTPSRERRSHRST